MTGRAKSGAKGGVGVEKRLRAEIVKTARAMNTSGLNQGTSGNVSARRKDGGGLFVTPSALDYDGMTADDLIALDWDGAWRPSGATDGADTASRRRARLKPSSEWRFHRDILAARSEFGAVVHAHPVHATALAVHGRGIGPFHYMIAIAGARDIRCAGYATFGTQKLSDLVITALEGRKACLMAHHGIIACGRDLAEALKIAVEVETLAAQFIAASALGPPPELSDEEIDAVFAQIKSVGYFDKKT